MSERPLIEAKTMAKQSNNRSALVSSVLRRESGWGVDPYKARCIGDFRRQFPALAVHADGRPCAQHRREGVKDPDDYRAMVCDDCYKEAGNGTIAFDLFKKVGVSALLLSIKTETVEKSGKLPSKLSLSTGNIGTIEAILDGIFTGSSLPTVVFASRNGENGPETDGLALFIDMGTHIRAINAWMTEFRADQERIAAEYVANGDNEGADLTLDRMADILQNPRIPTAPGAYVRESDGSTFYKAGFGKGKAPAAYLKWSSRRKCGEKAKMVGREGWSFPCVDEQGRKWSGPQWVHYKELAVSIPSMGYKRANWIPVDVRDLSDLVESQDWTDMVRPFHGDTWTGPTVG